MAYNWDAGAPPSDGLDYELMDNGTAWKCVKCWKRVDDGHLNSVQHQKNLNWYVHGPGNPCFGASSSAGSGGRQAPQQAAGLAAHGAVASAAAAAAGPWLPPQQALQDEPWQLPPQQPGGQLVGQPQQLQQQQQPGGQPAGPPQQRQQPQQQPGGQPGGQPKAGPPPPPYFPTRWESGIDERLERLEELVMDMRDTLNRLEAMALRQQAQQWD